MHLLLVDSHAIFGWLVQELVPVGVAVERVETLEAASRALLQHRVDVALFGLTAASLPWERLDELCRQHDPPIPVLYYSTVHSTPEEAGMPHLREEDFFMVPITGSDLRAKLESFVAPILTVEGKAEGPMGVGEEAERPAAPETEGTVST